ncbi:ring-cleaving dioxygenase [Euzebya sp.]|uniref:ring-cleaving dioxygenase n=1 Tax=Euzebya sp. TaxID=1971409 RepID=UPI003512F300
MAHPHGIHHVTAIATDPQANVDFYISVLGLRLVKTTVNFDDPGTYHLYYGDEAGSPGTVLTFFPWPGAPRGRVGTGQATTVAFSVPEGALGWWDDHLTRLGIDHSGPARRLEEEVVSLRDPDGMVLELVAHAGSADAPPWERGPIGADAAVRGFHSVTLTEQDLDPTHQMMAERLSFQVVAEDGGRVRYDAGATGIGTIVDVVGQPGGPRGLTAAGTVHHVAFRAPDLATEMDWRGELLDQGVNVTEMRDRQYFKSIYFREPGGVLFEIATDEPGFTADEPLLELGRHLKLPPWLEPSREQIAATLPQLKIPAVNYPGLDTEAVLPDRATAGPTGGGADA